MKLRLFSSQIVATLFVLIGIFITGRTDGEDRSYYERILAEKNIQPNAVGVNEYLSGLHPDEKQALLAKQLIQQLGTTDSFAKREEAMTRLLAMPMLPVEELLAAVNGNDPEVRWRAKTVLDFGKPESDRILYAVFKTIEEKKLAGVTIELLQAVSLCEKPHLIYAARQALAAAAKPDDADVLRKQLANDNVEVRIAAATALGQALGEKSSDELLALTNDPNEHVRLAAARALANFGERKCLPVLLELLSCEDSNVRTGSAMTLRQLCGQQFPFASYDPAEKRAAAIDKWRAWIDREGRTAKLNFPLQSIAVGVSYLNGNTLLAFGGGNKVAELDPAGEEVWTFTGAQNVWSAEKLSNGNVLIAAYSHPKVIEVNRKGEVVWDFDINGALNAKQLPNGNVLIADWNGNRAIEVDREKNIVWEYKAQRNCSDAHRLENGNTLISTNGGDVIEVTPDGKVTWEYPGGNCYGIHPLPNGNVLITELQGRVIEVTRDKEIVWEINEPGSVDAFRLPNGNTLSTGSQRFVEFNPNKEVVWEKPGANYGSARR